MRLPSILSTVPIWTPSAPTTSICSLISLISDLQEGRPLIAKVAEPGARLKSKFQSRLNFRHSGRVPEDGWRGPECAAQQRLRCHGLDPQEGHARWRRFHLTELGVLT